MDFIIQPIHKESFLLDIVSFMQYVCDFNVINFTIGLQGPSGGVADFIPLFRVFHDSDKFKVGFGVQGYGDKLNFSHEYSQARFLKFIEALDKQGTLRNLNGYSRTIHIEEGGAW